MILFRKACLLQMLFQRTQSGSQCAKLQPIPKEAESEPHLGTTQRQ